GYTNIRSTTEPEKVLDLLRDHEPDIVLLDLQMEHLDGFAVLEQLREKIPIDCFLPVLVLTADAFSATKIRALSHGANDFLTTPFNHDEVIHRVENLLRTRRLHLEVREQNRNLEKIAAARTAELEKTVRDLKKTQDKAIEHERLNAFGTMASGVTHDFNNALSVILGFSDVALMECDGQMRRSELENYLHTIITAGLDASRLVERLREFYRPRDENEPRTVVQLNEIVKQAVATSRPRWHAESLGSDVEIRVETDLAEIPPLLADAPELRDALMNLIFNAVDAMPKGGTISLTTAFVDGRIILRVRDGGIGMPEEVRRRCLEPFFTTKGEAGTGLGLAMVYGIVERHGGELEIESAAGAGTTFIISLPPALNTISEVIAPAPKTIRPLKILVVDDQPEMCAVMTNYLVNDCHDVTAVTGGRAALEAARETHFDLLITDHVMPEMSGKQLAAALREESPGTRVILLTSLAGKGVEVSASSRVINRVLKKPAQLIELRHAIAEVMIDPTTLHLPVFA
ncbi:MAG: hybrid sensor histidine kinase/response regulator, partial [Rhodanobacteraceae bacterium]